MIYLSALSHRMRQIVTITMCALAICFSSSCEPTNRNAPAAFPLEHMKSPAPGFIPSEALVKFKKGISQERIASILKTKRITIIAEIQRGRLYQVKILDDRSVESVVNQLSTYPEVEYAEPNYRYELQK